MEKWQVQWDETGDGPDRRPICFIRGTEFEDVEDCSYVAVVEYTDPYDDDETHRVAELLANAPALAARVEEMECALKTIKEHSDDKAMRVLAHNVLRGDAL